MLLAGLLCAWVPRVEGPDLILYNGNIRTMEAQPAVVQAIAVKDGRIEAVGTSAALRKLAGSRTRLVDLHGKTVLPGFVDCHMHPSPLYPEGSPYAAVDLHANRIRSVADLIQALRRQAAVVPKGQWIVGIGYDDFKLGRHPNRHDLDQVSTEHPIRISHVSGHISAVNSFALDKAGVNAQTPDPAGGAYDRDPDGSPNGVCRESAHISSSIAPTPQPTEAEKRAGLRRCFENFIAKGITTGADASASPDSLKRYRALAAAGMPFRINVMLLQAYFAQRPDKNPVDDGHVRVGTIKLFHGNSFSGRTCWVSQPYQGRPQYFGIPPATSQATLNAEILAIHRAGLQAAVHSNGDREIEMVLTAFENAQRQFPRPDPRFRIEHCSVCTPEILRRAKAVGAVLVFHSYMWENGDKLADYGPERADWLAPMRTARAQGIRVTSHSDYPVSAADPMLRIQDLVTRRTEAGVTVGKNQTVSVQEALRAWTIDGAYAAFMEKTRGSLAVGKFADFVVLESDPFKTSPLKLREDKVLQTYIGGALAWSPAKSVARLTVGADGEVEAD